MVKPLFHGSPWQKALQILRNQVSALMLTSFVFVFLRNAKDILPKTRRHRPSAAVDREDVRFKCSILEKESWVLLD